MSSHMLHEISSSQTFWPKDGELRHPIADELARHAADLGSPDADRALLNRGKRKKQPRPQPILRALGIRPYHKHFEIIPKLKSHGDPSAFVMSHQK